MFVRIPKPSQPLGRRSAKTVRRVCQHGFTLIELAVVIAIIAILAAVAIPYFADVQTSAEKASVNDFLTKLRSAYVLYVSSMNKTPVNGFSDFVTRSPLNPADRPVQGQPYYTVSTSNVGKGGCQVAGAASITCTATDFPNLARLMNGTPVTFTLQNEVVTHNVPQ